MSFTNMQPSLFGSSSRNHSQSGFARIEEADVASQNEPSDIYGQQQFNANYHHHQHALVNSGFHNQVPQLDFFRHNILGRLVQRRPYYGGMIGAYGLPMITPRSMDVPIKIPLAPKTGSKPVFVNSKQYHAIIRRRKSRAKAEIEKKLIKDRKPLHESRHQRAIKRPRGIGGYYATREEVDSLKATASGSSKHVHPESSEKPRGESVNSQNYHASSGYHFKSTDIGDDWLNISSPYQG